MNRTTGVLLLPVVPCRPICATVNLPAHAEVLASIRDDTSTQALNGYSPVNKEPYEQLI
jgi:hypothetical protein